MKVAEVKITTDEKGEQHIEFSELKEVQVKASTTRRIIEERKRVKDFIDQTLRIDLNKLPKKFYNVNRENYFSNQVTYLRSYFFN